MSSTESELTMPKLSGSRGFEPPLDAQRDARFVLGRAATSAGSRGLTMSCERLPRAEQLLKRAERDDDEFVHRVAEDRALSSR